MLEAPVGSDRNRAAMDPEVEHTRRSGHAPGDGHRLAVAKDLRAAIQGDVEAPHRESAGVEPREERDEADETGEDQLGDDEATNRSAAERRRSRGAAPVEQEEAGDLSFKMMLYIGGSIIAASKSWKLGPSLQRFFTASPKQAVAQAT